MRFSLLFIIGGGVMGFIGIQEFIVSHDASSEPVSAILAKLEAGEPSPNNHLRIGEHVALYPAAVFSFRKNKGDNTPPNDGTPVSYSFYPILSLGHPFMENLQKLLLKHGDKGIPPDEPIPPVDDFAVIVKSSRFKTMGEIPKILNRENSVQGLVINQIGSLKGDELRLVQQSFPRANLQKVLILEEGRTPASAAHWLGMIGGGGVLILVGIGLFFMGRKK